MNKSEAYKRDLEYARKYKENPFFVDEEDGTKYIFGIESNFAYSSPAHPEQEVKNMWTIMRHNLHIKENKMKKSELKKLIKEEIINLLEWPEPKDNMRINDIVRKAEGNPYRMEELAITMANRITDISKAIRRAEAAERIIGKNSNVAKVFRNRAEQLRKSR